MYSIQSVSTRKLPKGQLKAGPQSNKFESGSWGSVLQA